LGDKHLVPAASQLHQLNPGGVAFTDLAHVWKRHVQPLFPGLGHKGVSNGDQLPPSCGGLVDINVDTCCWHLQESLKQLANGCSKYLLIYPDLWLGLNLRHHEIALADDVDIPGAIAVELRSVSGGTRSYPLANVCIAADNI